MESNFSWQLGKHRYSLGCCGWWFQNPLRGLCDWLLGKRVERSSLMLRSRREQDRCYCPTGRTTEFRASLFAVGFRLWLVHDWTERPCSCEKIVDEARERLRAKYPSVEATR